MPKFTVTVTETITLVKTITAKDAETAEAKAQDLYAKDRKNFDEAEFDCEFEIEEE